MQKLGSLLKQGSGPHCMYATQRLGRDATPCESCGSARVDEKKPANCASVAEHPCTSMEAPVAPRRPSWQRAYWYLAVSKFWGPCFGRPEDKGLIILVSILRPLIFGNSLFPCSFSHLESETFGFTLWKPWNLKRGPAKRAVVYKGALFDIHAGFPECSCGSDLQEERGCCSSQVSYEPWRD